jgi:SAM-dependent methyltransferase
MPRSIRRGSLAVCYAATILLSAFLVFQVQPVISKFILPWFGGTPAVWTTCMLFFQVVLFAGYAYAHALTRTFSPRKQGLVHLGLIILGLVLLPITPDATWKPADAEHPTWRILCLLAANVGMPYFLLSSTGPLVQAWFARTEEGAKPYRLYALSNAGSLAALLTYPFIVEPLFGSTLQSQVWSLGFSFFGLLCGYCAWRIWIRRETPRSTQPVAAGVNATPENAPTFGRQLTWLALAACASVMLLATTNHVCQDVAVIPFLWVAPLSLYLLSFIICFENERWYSSRWCALGTAASILAVSVFARFDTGVHLLIEVAVYFTALFCICMLCHGELVRLKPSPRYLTSFYLMCSAGGALGGILVALVAPLVFPTYLELNFGLLGCYLLAIGAMSFNPRCFWFRNRWRLASFAVAFVGLLIVVNAQASALVIDALEASRSFYGTLSIGDVDREQPEEHLRMMRHGRVNHGMQFVADDRRREPTIFFGPQTGVGLTLQQFPRQGSMRVGVVGLGVGTLAAYAQPGDYYRFYEINPEVLRMAERYFSFLKDCQGKVDVVLGDARLSLEREPSQAFDVLVLDAFSGDAIPTHLLTSEALAIYERHLKPDGVLAIHISNRHVDLEPVVRGLADAAQMQWLRVESNVQFAKGVQGVAWWALLSRNETFLNLPALKALAVPPRSPKPAMLWTDDHSNLFEILQ